MPTFTVFKGTDSGRVTKGETTKEIKGDQVYVKVTASGLCGTDCEFFSRRLCSSYENILTETECSALQNYRYGTRP